MKRLSTEEKQKILDLEVERQQLEPARARYYKVSHELDKLRERQKYWEKQDKIDLISTICEYRAPEFPGMGYSGQSGFAYFSCHDNAIKLLEALNQDSWGKNTYFELVWTDFGKYRCEPSHHYSRGETVYAGTFVRIEE